MVGIVQVGGQGDLRQLVPPVTPLPAGRRRSSATIAEARQRRLQSRCSACDGCWYESHIEEGSEIIRRTHSESGPSGRVWRVTPATSSSVPNQSYPQAGPIRQSAGSYPEGSACLCLRPCRQPRPFELPHHLCQRPARSLHHLHHLARPQTPDNSPALPSSPATRRFSTPTAGFSTVHEFNTTPLASWPP